MFIITTIILMVTSNVYTLIDYRLELNKDDAKACTTPGFLCETCNRLVLCIDTGEGFSSELVEICPTGQKCLINQCTVQPDPKCDGLTELTFICNDVGLFPDPFNCKKYVFCVPGLKPYTAECEQNYGYNIATKRCDIKLDNNECLTKYPIDICLDVGQNGGLLDDPTIYYVCKQYSATNKYLYPFLHQCPHSLIYANSKCDDNNGLSTTIRY